MPRTSDNIFLQNRFWDKLASCLVCAIAKSPLNQGLCLQIPVIGLRSSLTM